MTTGAEMRAEEHMADAISAVLSRTPLFEGLPAPTYPELAKFVCSGDCPDNIIRDSASRHLANLRESIHKDGSERRDGPSKIIDHVPSENPIATEEPDPPANRLKLMIDPEWLVLACEIWHALGQPAYRHPIIPFIQAWFDSRPLGVKAEHRRRGILPKQVAYRYTSLPGLDIPGPGPSPGMVPAPEQGFLPGLIPDRPPLPTLLALYDRAGGRSAAGATPAPLEMRFFTTALMALPTSARDGQLHELPFTVGEIVEDWLNWKTKNYRAKGTYTGLALQRALTIVRNMCIEMPRQDGRRGPGGWYYPIIVSAGQGWDLTSKIALAMRLPDGSGVGPQVDRAMLSYLGNLSGPSYRAYLGLCCEWDRVGSHNGRLIRPTQPKVLRAPGGQVIDSAGRILHSQGGVPVYTPHDKRAVTTGEREPNPARVRYPEYDASGLLALCFHEHVLDMPSKKRAVYHSRARRAVEMIESSGGCVIERLGDNPRTGSLPWRIMPPDRLGPDPRRVERSGLQASLLHPLPIPL